MSNWKRIGDFKFDVDQVSALGAVIPGRDPYFVIIMNSGCVSGIYQSSYKGRPIEKIRRAVSNLLPAASNLVEDIRSVTDMVLLISKGEEAIYIDGNFYGCNEDHGIEFISKLAEKYGLSADDVRVIRLSDEHELRWSKNPLFWNEILPDEYKINK